MAHWRLAATSAALLLALGAVSTVYAADISRGDKRFMEKAAQAGTFEIDASKLADTHTDSSDVKSFAQMMVTDHTAVAQELKTLADTKGVTLPADLPRGEQGTIKNLQSDKGAKFDKLYTDKVAVSAHQEAVKLFTDASRNAKDADVKAFAQKVLPNLQVHLDKGMALQKMVATNAKASSGPTGTGTVSPASRSAPANVAPGAAGTPAR